MISLIFNAVKLSSTLNATFAPEHYNRRTAIVLYNIIITYVGENQSFRKILPGSGKRAQIEIVHVKVNAWWYGLYVSSS